MCVMIAVRLQWMTTARGLKTHKCSETFKLVLLCIWYRLHKNVRKETSSVNLLEVGHSHKWGRATGIVVVIDRKVTLHKHSSQFQAMGTFQFKSGHVAQVTNYQTVNWTMHGVLQDLLESCSAVLYLDTPLFTFKSINNVGCDFLDMSLKCCLAFVGYFGHPLWYLRVFNICLVV